MGKFAEDAKLQIEHGSVFHAFEKGVDSGDQKKFTFTGVVKLFSMLKGQAPVVRPEGVRTGLKVKPAIAGGNDTVDAEAGTAFVGGKDLSISAATDIAITRTPAGDTFQINSIVVDNAGVITAVVGLEGAAFVLTRGAAGGPPFIPVDSIELAQVKTTSDTSAPILATEIDLNVKERYDIPSFNLLPEEAAVVMLSALDKSHTASVTKGIWVEWYEPVWNDIPEVTNWKPVDFTAESQKNTTYDGVTTFVRKGIGDGSFEVNLKGEAGEIMTQVINGMRWLRFFPDKFKTDHHIVLGFLTYDRDNPPDDFIKASVTVTGSIAAIELAV